MRYITSRLIHQMWTEMPKGKNKKAVNKDRFISKMFLRCVLPPCYTRTTLTFAIGETLSSLVLTLSSNLIVPPLIHPLVLRNQ